MQSKWRSLPGSEAVVEESGTDRRGGDDRRRRRSPELCGSSRVPCDGVPSGGVKLTRPNPQFQHIQPAPTRKSLQPISTHSNKPHPNTRPEMPISTRPISRARWKSGLNTKYADYENIALA